MTHYSRYDFVTYTRQARQAVKDFGFQRVCRCSLVRPAIFTAPQWLPGRGLSLTMPTNALQYHPPVQDRRARLCRIRDLKGKECNDITETKEYHIGQYSTKVRLMR